MVFPSVPLYLDPPNWQQQQNLQQGSGNNDNSLQLPLSSVAAGGGTTIRPTSMVDRARLAKIQQPEATLKCPRCESTNTKFCYFNNYSLSQPRHFCKTCRRYWTRGGALRNVPVGGGCRRNKRSKGTSSKSSISADVNVGSASSSSATASRSCTASIINPTFIGSMHHLSDYNMPDLGLNFTGIPQTMNDFSLSGNSTILSGIAAPKYQWRFPQVQQFPFVTGLEPTPPIPPSLYPFSSDNVDASFTESSELLRNKSDSFVTQLCPVKMETSQGLDLSKQVLGGQGNEQYWGNPWTDLPGFSSSSTAHLL